MTWLDFKNAVKEFLPVDKDRLNVAGTYLEQLIRQAVIDLQDYIPEFCLGHETIYDSSDVTTEGYASVGTLPEEAELRDAYYMASAADDQCNRKPLRPYPWDNRFDLICANIQLSGCQFAISIDPQSKTFYVFPVIDTDRQVSLFWDGRKLDFADGDTVPFNERAAFAAAEYVSALIRRKVDDNLATYESHMATYRSVRSQLFSSQRERGRFKNLAPSPQPSYSCGNTTCAVI